MSVAAAGGGGAAAANVAAGRSKKFKLLSQIKEDSIYDCETCRVHNLC